MNIEFNVNVNLPPKDDFYLQWSHIYWWQMKFNMEKSVRDAMQRLLETGGYKE